MISTRFRSDSRSSLILLIAEFEYDFVGRFDAQLAGLAEITDSEDETAFYYINLPIFATKGFTITPELGVTDEKDAKSPTTGVTTEQGKTTYYGVRWFIRF